MKFQLKFLYLIHIYNKHISPNELNENASTSHDYFIPKITLNEPHKLYIIYIKLKKYPKMLPVQNYFDTIWYGPFKDEFKSCDYSHPEMA